MAWFWFVRTELGKLESATVVQGPKPPQRYGQAVLLGSHHQHQTDSWQKDRRPPAFREKIHASSVKKASAFFILKASLSSHILVAQQSLEILQHRRENRHRNNDCGGASTHIIAIILGPRSHSNFRRAAQ
jgi:hypothetical protein